MNIVVLAPDLPYPPNRGGRVDIWRRIEAFKALGHQVCLVYLFDPPGTPKPTGEVLSELNEVLAAHHGFAIERSAWRTAKQLANSHRVPWHVATRVPGAHELVAIEAMLRDFKPDLLWLDGPWFGQLGLHLSLAFGVPYAYRSHNVEFKYLLGQARAASSLRDQLAWRLACRGLEAYELRLMQGARAVFDISVDDQAYWLRRGVTRSHWLPPLPDTSAVTPLSTPLALDLLFVGNLRTPNNLQGLRWLVNDVLPLLAKMAEPPRLCVVGSAPDEEVRAWLLGQDRVDCYFDVPDVRPFQRACKVLVNPVAVGSGVQIKMLDMLMADAPVVTRSQGVKGLPVTCRELFEIADTPLDFAHAVQRGLQGQGRSPSNLAVARQVFSTNAVAQALAALDLDRAASIV